MRKGVFANEGGGLFDTEEAANLFAETQLAALDGEDSPQAQIIYRGPEQIYLPVEGDTYYSVYTQEEVELETRIMPCKSTTGGIYDWKTVNIKSDTVFKIRDFGSGSDYWLMFNFDDTNTNCVPVAETNILWYWGVKRGRSSILNKIGTSSNTRERVMNIYRAVYAGVGTDESGSISGNKLNGYRKFLGKEGTGVWNYKSLPNIISDIDDFMYELDDNCPIHLSVGIRSTAASDGYMKHSAMAFGYAQSTFPERYLFVMDGLKNYGRFVSTGYYDYFSGYKIWVA